EPLREICGDVRRVEKRQRDLVALPSDAQLLKERLQRMSRYDDVHWTVAPENEQPRRLLPTCQHPEEVERRMITPVQILEYENERGVSGQRFEGFGHLAQHPLLGYPDQLPTSRVAVVPLRQPA